MTTKPIINPLKSMSTKEVIALGETDPNPIVRFACQVEEASRYYFEARGRLMTTEIGPVLFEFLEATN